MFYYQSNLSLSNVHDDYSNESIDTPRWDNILTFRRHSTRAWSVITDSDAEELNSLLGNPVRGRLKRKLVEWCNRMITRNIILVLVPVLVILAWCSMPIPYQIEKVPASTPASLSSLSPVVILQTAPSLLPAPFTTALSAPIDTAPAPIDTAPAPMPHHDHSHDHDRPRYNPGSQDIAWVNFWWFLFFLYGSYNVVALWMITRIFRMYSFNWWPVGWSGQSAGSLCWLASMAAGAAIHLFAPHLEKFTITWVLLTFFMLTIPLMSAFWVIRSENRNVYRHSLTLTQQTFLANSIGPRIPASYVRFLWFCLVLVVMWGTTVAGGFYAWQFVNTLPHSGIEAFVYVYSWVGIVYALDFIAETVVEEKIRSYPLCTIFRLYFYLLYFIFYRNLFARLRNVEQFALIQIASSIWVVIFYPLRMTRTTHNVLTRWFGVTRDYNNYQKMVGQLFYTRTVAENVTMLGFLCWMNVLHFGGNAPVYPYFQFQGYEGDPYTYRLTMICSLGIWCSELITAYVTRKLFKSNFRHSITREAVVDLQRYPDTVLTLMLVSVHVMQSMLLALFELRFQR